MTAPLKLSHNELLGLLKYMFQGQLGHDYDWAALSEHVLWLETRGYGGLDMLMEAIAMQSLDGFSGNLLDTPGGFEIDCGGKSLIMGLPSIIDLAVDYLGAKGSCVVDITSACQLSAVIAVEGALMAQGICAQAVIDMDAGAARLLCSADANVGVATAILQRDHDAAALFYDESLRSGIAVSQQCYDMLNCIAARTLVEASEASRKGAGD